MKNTNQKATDQKETDQKETDQKETDQKSTDQRSTSQKDVKQKEVNQRNVKQRNTNKKDANQKIASKINVDQIIAVVDQAEETIEQKTQKQTEMLMRQFKWYHPYLCLDDSAKLSADESMWHRMNVKDQKNILFFCKDINKINSLFALYLLQDSELRTKRHYMLNLTQLHDLYLGKHPEISAMSEACKRPLLFYFGFCDIEYKTNIENMLNLFMNVRQRGNRIAICYTGDTQSFIYKYGFVHDYLKTNGFHYHSMDNVDKYKSKIENALKSALPTKKKK